MRGSYTSYSMVSPVGDLAPFFPHVMILVFVGGTERGDNEILTTSDAAAVATFIL